VLSYSRPWGASLGTSISYVGKRPDLDFAQFPSPRITLPAYAKVDLSAEYPLTDVAHGGLAVNARLENLFDKHYEDVLHFKAPGRTILLGGRASAAF
jgi:outer membrane cobalamin receptor